MFDAFLAKRPGWNFPAYYMTHVDDTNQHEWLVHGKKEIVKAMHLEGKLDIPGFSVLPQAMPSSLLEDPPIVPTLNKLIAISVQGSGGETTSKVMMPDDVIQTWYNHPEFGDEFKVTIRIAVVPQNSVYMFLAAR